MGPDDDFTSPRELHREDNPVLAVTDADAIVCKRIAAPGARWPRCSFRRPLRFDPRSVDVLPAEDGAPVPVFVRGGFWRRFPARDFVSLVPDFVEAKITLVNVNHHLCPRVDLHAIVREVRAAAALTCAHATDFGGDPGCPDHVAGGHPVAMLPATDWPERHNLSAKVIRGAVAISGRHDLSDSRLQPGLQLDGKTVLYGSPILHVPGRSSCLLVAVGEAGSAGFRRQSRDFHATRRAAALPGHLPEVPGLDHFPVPEELERPDSGLGEAAVRLAVDGDVAWFGQSG